jgi:hypothetical protein
MERIDPSDTIEPFVERWRAAERTGDADELGALLSDDFVGVGPVGFVMDKAGWLARFDQGLTYDDLRVDELVVRRHGGATVVVAHQHALGRFGETPLPTDLRMSLLVVAEPAGARCVAGLHHSFIGPPIGAVAPS